MASALILGCGYTGRRVAMRLLARGFEVTATSRDPAALGLPGARVLLLDAADPATWDAGGHDLALCSIPPPAPAAAILAPAGPRRVVYLSSTAVYGATRDIDEHTPAAPVDERGRARLAAERDIAGGPWSTLILRPAAIYGPGRGIHESMRKGTYRLAGGRWVSRIHVDDLAALAEAALLGDLKGAFPVADQEPCLAREIAGFCAGLLGVPMPSEDATGRTADRRVDGRVICRALGVPLRYPSYRIGIPALLDPPGAPR
jgi:nucleoside-diphosphate-sugar epimerase